MPLPEPNQDENRDDFLERCLSNDQVKEDFGEGTDQAVAVCGRIFDEARENANSRQVNNLYAAYAAALESTEIADNAEPDPGELDRVFLEFQDTVNMSASELEEWADTECSKKASQDRSPIERNLRLLRTNKDEWTAKDVEDAKKTISFVARMRKVESGEPAAEGCPSKRDIALKNWAFDPGKSMNKLSTNASTAPASTDLTRTETHEGKEWVVVPVVAITEGVRTGLPGISAFVGRDEIEATASYWDGLPVCRGHPMDSTGNLIRAHTKEAKAFHIGFISNPTVEDDKLKLEAWLDPDLASDEIARAQRGEQVEVSSGELAQFVPNSGEFGGEPFTHEEKILEPDHLAILPANEEGACNWNDGCGVRLNQSDEVPNMEADMSNDDQDKGNGPQIANSLREVHGFSGTLGAHAEHGSMSFEDIEAELRRLLNDRAESGDRFVVDATMDLVIYEVFDFENESQDGLFREAYNVDSEGNFSLAGNAVRVVPKTEYVPVTDDGEDQEGDEDMSGNSEDTSQLVDHIINCPCNGWSEQDRETLSGFSADQLEKMKVDPTKHPEFSANKSGEDEAATEAKTPEEFVANAPAEMQDVLNDALADHRKKHSELVEELAAHEACEYDKQELSGKSLSELRKLAKFARAASAGSGQPAELDANADRAGGALEGVGEYRRPSTHPKKDSE